MRIFGTTTSPFVRRVRIVAEELGYPVEMVDTNTPDGQAELRRLSPIWKVPAALIGDRVVYDSRAIIDLMFEGRGVHPLRRITAATRITELNFLNTVDEGLASAIRLFYVRRDGHDASPIPYLAKEQDRVRSTMSWAEAQVSGAYCTEEEGFGISEIALISAIGWMRFRQAYPVDDHPKLIAFYKAWEGRASVAHTAPVP
ncbi:MAG: glutathione S-transferase family protein [Myxococcota bacterium]